MHTGKEGAYDLQKSSFEVKVGLAEMLKGGVIVSVTSSEEARMAEDAGSAAVIALSFVHDDGTLGMVKPELILKIQEAVSIPVIAECRSGHIVEAQILEALFVDFICERDSFFGEDNDYPIDKNAFRIPFFSSASNLSECLRRIEEGASLIRTRADPAASFREIVSQIRAIRKELRTLSVFESSELMMEAQNLEAPYSLVKQVKEKGVLPVPLFSSCGYTNPVDAAFLVRLGAEGIFINANVFASKNPLHNLRAIVSAVNHFDDPEMLAKIAMGKVPSFDKNIRLMSQNETI